MSGREQTEGRRNAALNKVNSSTIDSEIWARISWWTQTVFSRNLGLERIGTPVTHSSPLTGLSTWTAFCGALPFMVEIESGEYVERIRKMKNDKLR
jgi:hypothetical protein